MILTFSFLVLSILLIACGLELGVKKGSQSTTYMNTMDKIAMLLIYAGILMWAVFVGKFLLWLFT